jgi:hypothetical protein
VRVSDSSSVHHQEFFTVHTAIHTGLLCVQWKTPDDGQKNCPKHVQFYSKKEFEKLMHLVGFIIRISMFCLLRGSIHLLHTVLGMVTCTVPITVSCHIRSSSLNPGHPTIRLYTVRVAASVLTYNVNKRGRKMEH